MKQIENMKSAKIGGGGLFRPLAKGMLVFSILIFLNYIKQIFVAIMNEQSVLNFLAKNWHHVDIYCLACIGDKLQNKNVGSERG